MVIPVRGLLTATIPSLPPDKIISPVGKGKNGTLLVGEEKGQRRKVQDNGIPVFLNTVKVWEHPSQGLGMMSQRHPLNLHTKEELQ